MTPVKLDASSSKKTPAVADVLYSTADGKLTLDAQTSNVNNTPIAICVIPEVIENFKNGDNSEGAVKTARFVSLKYMNYNTPTTGNKGGQNIFFGNYGTTIGNVKGETDKASYIVTSSIPCAVVTPNTNAPSLCLIDATDESNADLSSNTFKYFIIYLKNYILIFIRIFIKKLAS